MLLYQAMSLFFDRKDNFARLVENDINLCTNCVCAYPRGVLLIEFIVPCQIENIST